jgi:hypothetical protein
VLKIGGGVTPPSVLTKKDPEYTEEARLALRKAADAIRGRCDQIRVKIRAHQKAKLDKSELPKPLKKMADAWTVEKRQKI